MNKANFIFTEGGGGKFSSRGLDRCFPPLTPTIGLNPNIKRLYKGGDSKLNPLAYSKYHNKLS